jgi:hypothetical protein
LATSPADQQPRGDATGPADHEAQPRLPRDEALTDRGGHRDAVGDQRGGVVDQALTLEERDQAARHPELTADGDGGQWVGRRDDRAQRERRRPGQAGDQAAGDHRHGGGGDQDQAPDVPGRLARSGRM